MNSSSGLCNRATYQSKFAQRVDFQYSNEGDTGEANHNPPPINDLEDDELKKFIKIGIDKLSTKKLEKLKSLLERSSLSTDFGLATDNQDQTSPPKLVAPVLWADRTTGREVSPADFIRLHYGTTSEDGTWDNQGLLRADIKHADIKLYNAYSQQIYRNPEAAIQQLPTETRKEADPVVELNRQRAAKRRYYHRNKSI